MKLIGLAGFLCLGVLATAQDIRFDYDRSANFRDYKTYQWVDSNAGRASDQLVDQNIRRAVDEQLAAKGLRRVERGGDLQVNYRVAIDQEKEFNGFGSGPRWYGTGRVTTSTIEIGTMVVEFLEAARNQVVWSGATTKTLNINKDPDKNYRNLEKAMAKLFKNFPPGGHKS